MRRFLRSFWFRIGLEALVSEAILVALLWLLYQQVSSLQRFYFSDVLFIVGTLECLTASAGLMSRPYRETGGPWFSVQALPVQASEEERRKQALANFVKQKTFGIRLLVMGLLAILLSVVLVFIIFP